MPDQQTTINAIVHSSEEPPRMSGWRNYGSTRSEPPPSENLPQIVIRNGQGNASESRNQTPPKPVEGDKNRLGTSSVQHPIPHLQDDRSRATFYIGSVATDDGGLQDAGDRRPVVEGGENPSGHRRPSDEESEEDYYDVRNEDQVVWRIVRAFTSLVHFRLIEIILLLHLKTGRCFEIRLRWSSIWSATCNCFREERTRKMRLLMQTRFSE